MALVGAVNVARKETGVTQMYTALADAFKEHLLGGCMCVCMYVGMCVFPEEPKEGPFLASF